jgi:hypothetical protein
MSLNTSCGGGPRTFISDITKEMEFMLCLLIDRLDNITILNPQHMLIFRRPHVAEEQEEF